MAKRKTTGTTDAASAQAKGETVSGYFRKVFEENPNWLEARSNDALLARWLKDHPDQTKVPEKVRQNLAKSRVCCGRNSAPSQGRRASGLLSRLPPPP